MINTQNPWFENQWVLLNNYLNVYVLEVNWYLVILLSLFFEVWFLFFNDFFLNLFLQNVFIVPYTTWKNYLEPWFEDGWQVRCPFLKKNLNVFVFFACYFQRAHILDKRSACPNSWHPSFSLIPISVWVSILQLKIALFREKRPDRCQVIRKHHNKFQPSSSKRLKIIPCLKLETHDTRQTTATLEEL